MRWKKSRKRYPKSGDKKTVVKFAIIPVLIDNVWVWMERYRVLYTYRETWYDHSPFHRAGWESKKYLWV